MQAKVLKTHAVNFFGWVLIACGVEDTNLVDEGGWREPARENGRMRYFWQRPPVSRIGLVDR